MLVRLALAALLGLGGYLAVALILIASARPAGTPPARASFDLTPMLQADTASLPPLQTYVARDGAALAFREYASATATDTVLVLLHGSGWHSMQFGPLAGAISGRGLAHVVTPDLRGHGFAPVRRGDIDYIGQLEDDLADLITRIRARFPTARVIVGGHSSGGGLAVRFAGGVHGKLADGYLLLAPFLKHNAPTTRPNSGGWARPLTRRIIGLSMLNALGLRQLNQLTVIQFAMPQMVLDGPLGASATTAYSYRLNTAYAPRADYGRDLAAITQPLLVVAGAADESFIAAQYEPTIAPHTATGAYLVLPGLTHISLLTDAATSAAVGDWLTHL